MSAIYKKLEEVCEILDSRRVPITAKNRKTGIYPYYGANGLQDYVAEYIFDDELVLLAEDGGNFGSKERPIAYRVSGKCWVNNHAHVLKAKPLVNADYLCYALMFYDTEGLVNGATRQKLTQTAMRQMMIPYRNMTEQLQIADEINQVIRLIDKRKEELSLLDQLVKSRFVELFGDPVSNPYSLPEDTLPNLGKFGRGVSKHRPRNDIKLLGGKYPLIQTGDVANAGLYITSYSSTYSELGLKQSKMWEKGTLCITIAANIAKTAILEFDACFPDSVVGFIGNERTNNIFIHYWFSFFQAILESQAPESAQKNINLKTLSELKVIVPEKKKQDQFAAFVAQTDKYEIGMIPYLKVYNLSFTGELLFDNMPQYISADTHNKQLARSKVLPNDVLMNIVGPPLGKFSLVTDEFSEWNINQAIAIFRAKDRVLPRYLMAALMQPNVLRPFLEQAVGIRQLNLSLEQCRNLEFPLPPIEEQRAFVELSEQTDKSKLAVEKSLKQLEILKKSLMQQYFS